MPTEKKKIYHVDEKTYTLRPLSFFDVLGLMDVAGEMIEKFPPGRTPTQLEIILMLKDEIRAIIAGQIGATPEDLKTIPPDIWTEMIADFIELNLNENVLKNVERAIAGVKSMLSRLPRSSSKTATGSMISGAIQGGKLKAS